MELSCLLLDCREDIKAAYAGDIVAIGGLKEVITGETLCDEKAPIILERMDFPDPVIKIAIEPKSKVCYVTCYIIRYFYTNMKVYVLPAFG
jgi:hypothetical protein